MHCTLFIKKCFSAKRYIQRKRLNILNRVINTNKNGNENDDLNF